MARTLIVSDKQNSFFTANNIKVGTEIPTSGTYSKGDIVVNIGNNTATEAMWICVEAGTPGTWEVVGAGAAGGGGSIVAINDTVTVNNSVTEVSLGNLVGKMSSNDKLIVHYNSTHLMEGVDYEVNSEGTKIVKLTEGSWNESGEQALFAFELFKNVESVNGNEIVVDTKLTSIVNNMMVTAPTTEVEIGVEGFDKNNDTLLVFKNGVIMVEGVDYNVSEDNTKIISINEVWNESNVEEYGITFVVFKEVVVYDEATGGITMGMLGSDVRETINNLTETTLQHSELIESLDEKVKGIDLSGYATKEDLENVEVDLSPYQQKTDNSLQTSSKDVIGAINELFQNANNGKELIASAIGEPLNAEDTFSAMSNDINGLLSTFKTNMMNNGITVESSDKFKQLIDKLRGGNVVFDATTDVMNLMGFIPIENEDYSSSWTTTSGAKLDYPSFPGIEDNYLTIIRNSDAAESWNNVGACSNIRFDLTNYDKIRIKIDVKNTNFEIGFMNVGTYITSIIDNSYPAKLETINLGLNDSTIDVSNLSGEYNLVIRFSREIAVNTEFATLKYIELMTEDSNSGIQYAEGTYEDFTEYLTTSGSSVEVPYELNFTPTLIFVKFNSINNTSGTTITNVVISNKSEGKFYMNYALSFNIDSITSNSFSMIFSYTNNSNITFRGVTWYAIGIGEEDTTLRDSLASILEDEGVEVLPEDTMADLIIKTDEEFDRKIDAKIGSYMYPITMKTNVQKITINHNLGKTPSFVNIYIPYTSLYYLYEGYENYLQNTTTKVMNHIIDSRVYYDEDHCFVVLTDSNRYMHAYITDITDTSFSFTMYCGKEGSAYEIHLDSFDWVVM